MQKLFPPILSYIFIPKLYAFKKLQTIKCNKCLPETYFRIWTVKEIF